MQAVLTAAFGEPRSAPHLPTILYGQRSKLMFTTSVACMLTAILFTLEQVKTSIQKNSIFFRDLRVQDSTKPPMAQHSH